MEQIKSEVFISMLKNYGILFEKSKTPGTMKAKGDALAGLKEDFANKLGIQVDAKNVMKRINNIKMRVKQKTDLRQTGNKPISLKEWEKKVFDMMGGHSNPVFNRLEGKFSVQFIELFFSFVYFYKIIL